MITVSLNLNRTLHHHQTIINKVCKSLLIILVASTWLTINLAAQPLWVMEGFNESQSAGSTEWGDYDNDGDLDLLIMGFNGVDGDTKIYNNEGDSTFTEEPGLTLPGIWNGEAAWGDYNNDGYLDILMTGYDGSASYTAIYKNNGNKTFSVQTQFTIRQASYSDVDWGDYDNDGDLDFVLIGTGNGYQTNIYKNDGVGSKNQR